jgi:hypothetical protein
MQGPDHPIATIDREILDSPTNKDLLTPLQQPPAKVAEETDGYDEPMRLAQHSQNQAI